MTAPAPHTQPDNASAKTATGYDEGFSAYISGLRHVQLLRHVQTLEGDRRHEFTRGFLDAKDMDQATCPSNASLHAAGRTRAGNDIGGI